MVDSFPWAYVNDRFVRSHDAAVPITDHGLLYGDSCFEALRVYHRHPAFWREHLRRLAQSARLLDIPYPGDDRWIAILGEAIERNRMATGMVRLTLTRGVAPPGLRPGEPPQPTVLLLCVSLPERTGAAHTAGVPLATAPYQRIPAASLPAGAKTGNYLPNVLARRAARAAGADEALFTDAAGRYLEGTVSSLFYVDPDGRLTTPPLEAGILPGITRDHVLRIAAAHDLPTRLYAPTRDELLTAAEVFVTGTGYEVTPASHLDGTPLRRGPWAATLHEGYLQAVAEDRRSRPLPPPQRSPSNRQEG
jgi:branched-chain amino acid aminotransferase